MTLIPALSATVCSHLAFHYGHHVGQTANHLATIYNGKEWGCRGRPYRRPEADTKGHQGGNREIMSSHPGDDTESDVLGRESYHGDHKGWLTLQVRERGTKEIEMRAN